MNWDKYFLNIAKEVSKQSKCLSRQIGAVLVKDKVIIGTGYNGPPRGVKHCNERLYEFYNLLDNSNNKAKGNEYPTVCPRRGLDYKSGQGLHLCQAGHAERNAIIQCARHGIATKGATLYCYCPIPCKDCVIEIINAGIQRLVYLKGDDYDKYSRVLLEESKIEYKEYEKSEIL